MVSNYVKSSACCHYGPGYTDLGSVTELFCKGIHITPSWENTKKNTSLKHTSSHSIIIYQSSHNILRIFYAMLYKGQCDIVGKGVALESHRSAFKSGTATL